MAPILKGMAVAAILSLALAFAWGSLLPNEAAGWASFFSGLILGIICCGFFVARGDH